MPSLTILTSYCLRALYLSMLVKERYISYRLDIGNRCRLWSLELECTYRVCIIAKAPGKRNKTNKTTVSVLGRIRIEISWLTLATSERRRIVRSSCWNYELVYRGLAERWPWGLLHAFPVMHPSICQAHAIQQQYIEFLPWNWYSYSASNMLYDGVSLEKLVIFLSYKELVWSSLAIIEVTG